MLTLIVAGLPALGALFIVTYLAIEQPGTIAAPRLETISEAVVTGNPALALELMADGADVDAPARVRPGLLERDVDRLTPLEAALLVRNLELLQLLLDVGATPSASGREDCLALEFLPEAIPLLRARHAEVGRAPLGEAGSDPCGSNRGTANP